MGVIWEVFAALTEGLGEAASVRVSFYLTEGLPMEAKRLANKVAFMAFILVLGATSIFLMAGPNIAVALSTDSTIQHLFTELVGLTGLANVSMTFAQVYWSLAGAQGCYGLASTTILFCRWLVILPIASACIFGYFYDLVSVAGAVAVGYAVAAFALACFVFRSDWERLALSMREDFEAADGVAGAYPDGEALQEEDDESESSPSGSAEEELEDSHDEIKNQMDARSIV